MPRIRTIKPEFFRHERLQDLEANNPKLYVMLVFAGLWTLCDNKGRFEFKPRTIKLDILPFLNFDIEKTLMILSGSGFIRVYESGGERFGVIPSFLDHQRLTSKETQDGEKYPEPPEGEPDEQTETSWVKPGSSPGHNGVSSGSTPDAQEGKGKEGKWKGREGEEKSSKKQPQFDPPSISDVIQYFNENGYTEDSAKRAFSYYNEAGWKDSKGNKVLNWKQKMISVWFKPENKKPEPKKPQMVY